MEQLTKFSEENALFKSRSKLKHSFSKASLPIGCKQENYLMSHLAMLDSPVFRSSQTSLFLFSFRSCNNEKTNIAQM